ncbi:MAG: hypothetical protein AAFY56_12310 [Pseudomonadota bacterium]
MKTRHSGMIDLEVALIADTDNSVRDLLLQRLTDEGRSTKARLDKGLPPEEAQKTQRYLHALLASHQTIRAVWHYHHGETKTG